MQSYQEGQATIGYIIIIVIIAISGFTIMGVFSDTVGSKMIGAKNAIDGYDCCDEDDYYKRTYIGRSKDITRLLKQDGGID